MTGPDSERFLDDPQFQSLLVECLEKLERGEALDRAQLLRRHPEFADALAAFLADQESLRRIAGGLRDSRDRHPAETMDYQRRPNGFAPGERLRYVGEYEILEEIARGGMGIVYKARQVSLNRLVALKMILAGELATEQDVQRFRREAEAAGNFDHPHLVPIYEVGEDNGQHYYSMKLIEGGSLSQQLPHYVAHPRAAAQLLARVAHAVHHAHQRGVLHRDLKPANILIDAQGQPHVTDFGLARRVGPAPNQTQSGAVVGTPSYMAPEQASARKDLTTAVEIYSLGAILYEALTGQAPFRAESTLETLLQVVQREPEKPRRRKPDVDSDLETICLKCLEKQPERRYGSALELATDLERWLAGVPIAARPVSAAERGWRWCRRNPLVAGLAATVVLVLAVGSIVSALLAVAAARAARLAESRSLEAFEQTRRAQHNEERMRQEKDRGDRHLRLAELRLYAGQLALAQKEWQDDRGARALEILAGCQWDLRGLEYRLLHNLYTSNQLTLDGKQRWLNGVAFSPSGKLIASSSWEDGLQLWDVEKRQLVWTQATKQLASVAFSPDGTQLVAGSLGKAVRVFEAASGRELYSLAGHTSAVVSALFSPDGTRIVSASADRTLRVWDVRTRRELLTLKGHTLEVNCVAISPDGKRLASGCDGNSVRVWDAATGKELATLSGHETSVRDVVYSPDAKLLASVSLDGVVRVWDADKLVPVRTLGGRSAHQRGLAFSPDGQLLACTSLDGHLQLWDAGSGQLIRVLKGHAAEVTGLGFRPDGRSLVSCSLDGTVKVWDAGTGQDVSIVTGHDRPIRCLAVPPGGGQVVGGCDGGTVRVWDAASGEERFNLRPQEGSGEVLGVAYSPTGGLIASCRGDHAVRLWNARTGQLVRSLPTVTAATCLAFSPDGKRLVSDGAEVWEVETGQELLALKGQHEKPVRCVAFSPDGTRIATGSLDATVKLWDAETGRELHTLKGHDEAINQLAYSPDGECLVSASADATLRMWDCRTGRAIRTLQGHKQDVTTVTYSPDGRCILSGSEDKTVKVWDAGSGQELLTLSEHQNGVTAVVVSRDGGRLFSASADGILRTWDLRPMGERRTLPTGPRPLVNCLAFDPAGERLATGSHDGLKDGTIQVWDVRKGLLLLSLPGLTKDVCRFGFSPDGQRLSGTDGTGQVLTWDAATGELLPEASPAPLPPPQNEVIAGTGCLKAVIERGQVSIVRVAEVDAARRIKEAEDRVFLRRVVSADASYHWRQAEHLEKTGRNWAAAFHLRRLLLIEPKNQSAIARLATVEERLRLNKGESR